MLKLRFRRLVGQCRDLERPFTHSEVISVIFSILSVGRCMDKDPNLEANQNTLFYFHRSRANLEGGQGGHGRAGQGALVFNVKHAAMERGVAVGRERGRGGPSLPHEGRQAPFPSPVTAACRRHSPASGIGCNFWARRRWRFELISWKSELVFVTPYFVCLCLLSWSRSQSIQGGSCLAGWITKDILSFFMDRINPLIES